jgi:hypothetical protein
MSPFRRMKVGRMVAEIKAWNLHGIVSHAKMVAQPTWPNQAGNSPQHQAHNNRIFTGLGVVVGPVGNGPETALLIEGLRSVIGTPNL